MDKGDAFRTGVVAGFVETGIELALKLWPRYEIRSQPVALERRSLADVELLTNRSELVPCRCLQRNFAGVLQNLGGNRLQPARPRTRKSARCPCRRRWLRRSAPVRRRAILAASATSSRR